MAGDNVDLVNLHLTLEDHGRGFGGKPVPQLLGHRLHIRDAKVQLAGELPVGEVQAHEI